MSPLEDGDPVAVGPYVLRGRLGQGGMGRVFLAAAPDGEQVAVKVMLAAHRADPEFRKRFEREVSALRSVGGSRVPRLIDADPGAGTPWLAMAYIAGPALETVVREDGPLAAPGEVRALGLALAEGLAAMHARGLVHRDLKPANILMADDGPWIIDLGIARSDEMTAVTQAGFAVGTTRFMSPEQLEGASLGPPTDIFSLGSVLAYAATGRHPFAATRGQSITARILGEPPDLDPVSVPLRDIIRACLAKDPALRPAATTVASALAGLEPARPPEAAPRAVAPFLPPRRPSPQPRLQVRPATDGWCLVTADPAGTWIAAADADGTLSAWDAATGLPVRSWPARAPVTVMAAAARNVLATGHGDGTIRLWDVACDDSFAHFPGPAGTRVTALAFDSTGSWLAAGDGQGGITVRDCDGRVVAAPRGPAYRPVEALALDWTRGLLAAGTADDKVRVWAVGDRVRPRATLSCTGTPRAIAFSEDGELAVGTSSGLQVWDAALSAPAGTGHEHSDCGRAVTWGTLARRWLTIGTFGPTGPVMAAAITPAGLGVVVDDDDRVHAFDPAFPERSRPLPGTDMSLSGVAPLPSGGLVMAEAAGDLHLWDRQRRRIAAGPRTGSPVTAVAAARDGTLLVIAGERGPVTAFSVVSGDDGGGRFRPCWTRPGQDRVTAMAVSPDSRQVVIAADQVRLCRAADGADLVTLPGGPPGPQAAAFGRTGHQVAAGGDGLITVWDNGALMCQLTGHRGPVLAVAFGPGPGQLLSAGGDGTLRIWDLDHGREVRCPGDLGYRPTALATSPADGTVAIGCADGAVRLYSPGGRGDPGDWTDLPVLAGHVHWITGLCFDVAGRRLVSASWDGTARVWDPANRTARLVLVPEADDAWAAAEAADDGTWIIHGDPAGRLWHATGLARTECRRAEPRD